MTEAAEVDSEGDDGFVNHTVSVLAGKGSTGHIGSELYQFNPAVR